MSELLNVWLIEAIAIVVFVIPLGMIVAGISELRHARRERKRRMGS